MEITATEMNRVVLIALAGRIDSSNATQLGEAFNTWFGKGRNNLVVDLEKVDYISSAGLRELVSALKRARQEGGDLRLCAPPARVREVLELAGLTSVFAIYDTQVLAVGSF